MLKTEAEQRNVIVTANTTLLEIRNFRFVIKFQIPCSFCKPFKGTPINDLEGGRENREKKFQALFLLGMIRKKISMPPPGKIFQKAIFKNDIIESDLFVSILFQNTLQIRPY